MFLDRKLSKLVTIFILLLFITIYKLYRIKFTDNLIIEQIKAYDLDLSYYCEINKEWIELGDDVFINIDSAYFFPIHLNLLYQFCIILKKILNRYL